MTNRQEKIIMQFLDPKNDIAFKKIFGDDNHKNLTINFLNNVLNLSGNREIKNVTFKETAKLPDRIKGKSDFAHFMPQFSTSTNIKKYGSATTDANAKECFKDILI